jgi:hypothetical protein
VIPKERRSHPKKASLTSKNPSLTSKKASFACFFEVEKSHFTENQSLNPLPETFSGDEVSYPTDPACRNSARSFCFSGRIYEKTRLPCGIAAK